ncbi:MAG: hypothetical protein IPI55_01230 [Flavobacteriales bacterium]|nr:hypothetical protein [Flavobacteriales bacterium]
MKTTRLLTVMATLSFSLAACEKEGPIGPQGPAGPQGQSGNHNIEIYQGETAGTITLPITTSPVSWGESNGIMEVTIPGGLDSGDVILAVADFRVDDIGIAGIPEPISIMATLYLAPNSVDAPGSGNGVDMSGTAGSGASWDPVAASSMYFSRSSSYTWTGSSIPSAFVTLYAASVDASATGVAQFAVGEISVVVQRYEQ